MRITLLLLLLLCFASTAFAQTPANPTQVAFDHVDYTGTDSYVLGYFSGESTAAPVQEASLAKPSSCAPCTGTLESRPVAFGTWWVAVRAVAGETSSPWSNRVPFLRVPVAPVVRGVS